MLRRSKFNAPNPVAGRQPGWGFLLYSTGAAVVVAAVFLWVGAGHSEKPDVREAYTAQATAKPVTPFSRAAKEGILNRVMRRGIEGDAGPLSIEALLECLRDPSQSMANRRAAARKLVVIGSPQAMAALMEVLRDGPSQLKAAVAESLGGSPSPEALAMLLDLAGNADETTARGALRGLAIKGGPEALGILSSILFDEAGTAGLRAEAALALGGMRQPEALESLTRALGVIRSEVLLEHVLDGLGHHTFAETETAFRDFLNRGDISAKVRCAAIEALGHTTNDATPFILSFAGDEDPGVRAAAGWALALSENPGEIRPQLIGWLKHESESSVRLRLYQALIRQENVAAADVLPLVRRENDADARLAGLGLLADAVRSNSESEAGRYFEINGVSDLKNAVYSSSRLDQSLSAIMALGRAGTPSAVALLGEIANHPTDAALRDAAKQAIKRNAAD
jgi:HEAT repeat protein